MRPYPRNSPQAAARIVALAMLSDGHLAQAELEVVARSDARERLGLGSAEFHDILHGLCEDLLLDARESGSDVCRIEPDALATLMAEIDDQDLRSQVLELCIEVIDADGEFSKGESAVVAAAVEHWRHPLWETVSPSPA